MKSLCSAKKLLQGRLCDQHTHCKTLTEQLYSTKGVDLYSDNRPFKTPYFVTKLQPWVFLKQVQQSKRAIGPNSSPEPKKNFFSKLQNIVILVILK